MNKTAAHRSITRRAVLDKVAGVTKQATPLYTDEEDIKNYNRRKIIRRALLTAAGGLVGMGAGKSMFMNPWTGQGGHPLLGAGIGAGAALLGTTLMDKYYESAGLDPTVPSLKARVQAEAIRPSSGGKKAAEANEAAYVEGFCKAAEIAGVDPVALCKQAGSVKARLAGALGSALNTLGRAKKGVSRGFGRYIDLLSESTARSYQDKISAMDRLMGKMQGAGHNFVISARSVGGRMVPTREGDIWQRAFRQKGRYLRKLEDEMLKSHLTQAATLGVVGGGGGLLVGLPLAAVANNITRRKGQTQE